MTMPCFDRRILNRWLQGDAGKTVVRGASAELTQGRCLQITVSFAMELRKRGVGPQSVLLVDVEEGTWILHLLLRLAISLLGARWVIYKEHLAGFEPATHLVSTDAAKRGRHRNFILFEPSWFNLTQAQAAQAAPSLPGLRREDALCWLSTSATTGKPKLLKYITDELEAYFERSPFPGASLTTLFSYDGDRAIWSVYGAMDQGIVLIDEADPRVEARRPDCMIGSPVQLANWTERIGPPPPGMKRLPLVFPIGGTISRQQAALWLGYFEKVTSIYAGTEMGVIGQFEASGPLAHDYADYTVLPDRAVEILNDQGQPCAPGEAGELRVRSPRLDFLKYYAEDGWFHPGDLGYFTPEGRIVILGRTGDVLNIGGVKMHADFLGEGLRAAGLAACAVPFEERGPDGHARLALLCDPGGRADHAGLAAQIRSWAEEFPVPRIASVYFSATRPINANGKLSQRLAAGIAQGLAAR